MSVLGISLGAHSVYVSVYNSETSTAEVLCDDLGYRSIPCAVAFRAGSGDSHSVSYGGAEVLVGHAAKQQEAKNPTNTFVDLRSMLFNQTQEKVFVPILDKEISVEELASHLFGHIFNQVKQQTAGKHAIKDSFLCLPAGMSEEQVAVGKTRLTEAAKHGGLRVKGFCAEGVAPIVALGLDTRTAAASNPPLAVTAVIDMGWNQTSISFYTVSGGVVFPIFSNVDASVNAKTFNDSLVKFCVKDFARRSKVDCADSKRSITRLSLQCEQGIKILINSQETTIVVDSLLEGMDYSGKISRSRFEDLCSISAMSFRNFLKTSLESAHLDAGAVSHVILAGGGGALPFVHNIVGQVFNHAVFPRNRYESVELGCAGAAIHGGAYLSQGEEVASSAMPTYEAITSDIVLSNSKEVSADNHMVLFPKNSIVHSVERISFAMKNAAEFFVFRAGESEGQFELLGEVCLHPRDAASDKMTVEFRLTHTEGSPISLDIYAAGEESPAARVALSA